MSDLDRAKDLVEFSNDVDHAISILERYPPGQNRDAIVRRLIEARSMSHEIIGGVTVVESAPMASRMS